MGVIETAGMMTSEEKCVPMGQLTRNAQVLKFFAQAFDGIGSTQLLKLAYMADLEARKYLGRPITTFNYTFHNHGPFDRAFYDAVEELCSGGLVRQEEESWLGYATRPVYDTGQPVLFDFSAGDAEILEWVLAKYRSTPLKELLEDIVYETEPMKQAEKGQRVPMEVVDLQKSKELGLDFNAILEAEQQAMNGDAQPIREVFSGLRAGRTRSRSREH